MKESSQFFTQGVERGTNVELPFKAFLNTLLGEFYTSRRESGKDSAGRREHRERAGIAPYWSF